MASAAAAGDTVDFNVSGTLVTVARSTIAKHPHALLARMVSSEWGQAAHEESMKQVGKKRARPQNHPSIFVDRDAKLFELVLSFYRDGRVHVPPLMPKQSVVAELEYFCLDFSSDDVVVTAWNLTDHIAFKKSFSSTLQNTMQEIVIASKTDIDQAAQKHSKATDELKAAMAAAMNQFKDTACTVDDLMGFIGQGIAVQIVSKVSASFDFPNEVVLSAQELTTDALDKALQTTSRALKTVLTSVCTGEAGKEYTQTLLKMLTPSEHLHRLGSDFDGGKWGTPCRFNVAVASCPACQSAGISPHGMWWNVSHKGVLAAVDKHLAPMDMRMKVVNPQCNGLLQTQNQIRIKLVALDSEDKAADPP